MAFTPYYYCIDRPFYNQARRKPFRLALLLLLLGGGVLFWTSFPILKYELTDARRLGQRSYVSPISFTTEAYQLTDQENDSPMINADNWFPAVQQLSAAATVMPTYSLSIPQLGINNAEVEIGGTDLSRHLIHYGGTAFPGLPGTAVVFGHSVLPQFFDPKNYMAIFSTLHTLELGDLIVVDYDGIQYHYQVIDMFEVQPNEVSILDQDFQNRYLLLVTCTPPGTYLRRLVVKSKLVTTTNTYYETDSSN